jgi:Asp-tRNA(Asn)/Glu-tRNA(Gln) amidotransferase A subunit family amidase
MEHPVSLAEIARAVRERRVSAVEFVRTSLERIERLNPPINAVIGTRPDEAFAEAEALDARVAAGEDPGPLAGVPLLVKDNERLTGMRTTHGSTLRRNVPPETEDGHIPRRLRAAGAIAVGKTNVPEFTFAGYTVNDLFGATANPWNLDYSPGGSSGGSAAAMAAGMAPLATATDGGGSIRIPASFCGLAGLKPTNGVIARDPIPAWIDLSTYGPLGHSVADVRLLLELERGPAPGDPTALPVPLPLEGPMPARAFAASRLVPFEPPAPAHEMLFRSALERIERDLGIPVELRGSVFHAGDPYDDWFAICGFEHLHALGRETVLATMGLFSPDFRDAMEAALRIAPETYMEARRRRFDYCRELDLLLGDDAVLLTPTMGMEGWRPDGTVPGSDRGAGGAEGYNTDPLNLTGHPALSVPAGLSPSGMPFGLQIVGPRFRDDLVLTLGQAWEQASPWPMSAPGYEPFPVP